MRGDSYAESNAVASGDKKGFVAVPPAWGGCHTRQCSDEHLARRSSANRDRLPSYSGLIWMLRNATGSLWPAKPK